MKRSRVAAWAAAIAAAGAIAIGMDYVVDVAFHPWVYGLPGTSSPLGAWVGSVNVPGLGRHAVLLDLRHEVDLSTRKTGASTLDGSVRLCGGAAEKKFDDRTVHSPANGTSWNGSRFQLYFRGKPESVPWPDSMECRAARANAVCELQFTSSRGDEVSRKRVAEALRRRDLQAAREALTDTIVERIDFRRSTAAEFGAGCPGVD